MSIPYPLMSKPGVQRDGTILASEFYSDGVWVRWQRSRPRKMGGYRAMSTLVNGPVRSVLVDSRAGVNSAHYFSQYGIQRQQFSNTGAGGNVEDRTPAGFFTGQGDPRMTWSHAVMFAQTGGNYAALIAAATPDLNDIGSDTAGPVFQGAINSSAPLVQMFDGANPLLVSGGVTVWQPFPVAFGSAGLVKIGNPNDLGSTTWTAGGSSLAIEANVAGTKIVYGAPVRGGGQSPAGLLWALDALIRATFVGGTGGANDPLWRFDTLASPTSVLSKKAIVEHDGKFYWPGTDRFLFYNGVVQELPNDMNQNWFFDNLNYAARNKVWGTKVTRFGEIWWFYPRGDDTECRDAIIYNYRENTWYDAHKERSAGGHVQTFQFPIWAGSEDSQPTLALPIGLSLITSAASTMPTSTLTFASTTGVTDGMAAFGPGIPENGTVASHTGTTTVLSAPITANVPISTQIAFTTMTDEFVAGEIVTGATSGARARVLQAGLTKLNVVEVTGAFLPSEVLNGSFGAVARTIGATYTQSLESTYQHEYGVDKIVNGNVSAIPSSFTTNSFGMAFGQPGVKDVDPDAMTQIERLDPDFGKSGTALTVEVYGRSYTKDEMRLLQSMELSGTTDFLTFNGVQERELQVKISSNVAGGFYEQGNVFLRLNPGDARSSGDVN